MGRIKLDCGKHLGTRVNLDNHKSGVRREGPGTEAAGLGASLHLCFCLSLQLMFGYWLYFWSRENFLFQGLPTDYFILYIQFNEYLRTYPVTFYACRSKPITINPREVSKLFYFLGILVCSGLLFCVSCRKPGSWYFLCYPDISLVIKGCKY